MNTINLVEIANALEVSGMTRRYGFVAVAVRLFLNTGNPTKLIELMKNHPGIINQALAIANSGDPFLPRPEGAELEAMNGRIKLGTVNDKGDEARLDDLDYTRGLFIAGEIGSGKTYSYLRQCRQFLDIPKNEREHNLIFIQAQRKDADHLILDYPTLRIIERQNLRRNIFQSEKWDTPQDKIAKATQIIAAVGYLMSRSEPLFNKSVKLAAEHKGVYENPNVKLTFSDISKYITPAAHQLNLTGFDMKNNCDKLQLFLSFFIDSGEIYNCVEGFTIEDFYSKEDIILNIMDESSDYVLATIVTDILVTLQRYYEKHPLPKAKLRTLIIIDESRRIFPAQDGFMDHKPHALMERFMTTRRPSGIGIIAGNTRTAICPFMALRQLSLCSRIPHKRKITRTTSRDS